MTRPTKRKGKGSVIHTIPVERLEETTANIFNLIVNINFLNNFYNKPSTTIHSHPLSSTLINYHQLLSNYHQRMAALLGYTFNPNRDTLIEQITSMGLLEQCEPWVQELFSLLEKEFRPHDLVQNVVKHLNYMREQNSFSEYCYGIEELLIIRLCQQLSKVRRTKNTNVVLFLFVFLNVWFPMNKKHKCCFVFVFVCFLKCMISDDDKLLELSDIDEKTLAETLYLSRIRGNQSFFFGRWVSVCTFVTHLLF